MRNTHFILLINQLEHETKKKGPLSMSIEDFLSTPDTDIISICFQTEIKKLENVFNALKVENRTKFYAIRFILNHNGSLDNHKNDLFPIINSRTALRFWKNTLIMNEMNNIIKRELHNWIEDDKKYLEDNYYLFHFFYSHQYFIELYEQVKISDSQPEQTFTINSEEKKLLLYLLNFCLASQKVFFKV